MKKLILSGLLAVGMTVALTGVAFAHTGSITATQSCTEVTVTAVLDSNVSADRTWAVTSTIPGITGSSGSGPGTGAVVYTQTIPSNGTLTGSATLTISTGEEDEFSATATIEPVGDCPTPPPPPCEQTEQGCPTPPPPPPPTCDNTPSLCPTPPPPVPSPSPSPSPSPVPTPSPKPCPPAQFPCWHSTWTPKPPTGPTPPPLAMTGANVVMPATIMFILLMLGGIALLVRRHSLRRV